MTIRRRLLKRQKAAYHREHGTLQDGPPSVIPMVPLPNIPRFRIGLPGALQKHNIIYIGSRTNFHWPRRTKLPSGHLKMRYPSSGPVGFSVWRTEKLIAYVEKPGYVVEFHAYDRDEEKLEHVATLYNYGQFKERIDGKIGYEYIGSYFADDEQEAAYWTNRNAYDSWPDWLHDLEKRSLAALYHEAEVEFGLKRKWGSKR